MARYYTAADLDLLRVLREAFLSFESRKEPVESEPYWYSSNELALYDRTFGCRIGWKWDAVLEELRRRGRLPTGATILDWGCGSGTAARRFMAFQDGVQRVYLWDHSPVSMDFAAETVAGEYPGVEVLRELPHEPVDVLLLSHVLNELSPAALESVLTLAKESAAVLWVEPGSRRPSRGLSEVRERLTDSLDVLAPCTHQAACGALSRKSNWCHFFARPPANVYTEGRWTEFGRELGIDLRSLPYSFLALARRGAFDLAGPGARLLGRPHLSRGRAEFQLCDEAGVKDVDYLQRTDKGLFKSLEKVAGEPWLFDATIEGQRVTVLQRRDA